MTKKSGVPAIRFKGFTDTWEQRELRTAATFSKGSSYSKNDLKENGTPIILYGRLYTKYETVISEVDTFVDVQPNSVYSTGHEVIVPASGETAEDISRASFVAKSGILLGGDLNIIVPDDYINPVFLALTISNGNQQKELSKRAQGKSVVHIHNSDLENVVLLYPKYEEQERIGEYFSKLDSLITLHQRKYIHYLLYHFSTKNAIIFDEFFLLPIPFYHISHSEFAQLQKIPGKFRGFLIIQIFLHTSPTCGNRQYSSFFRECGESS